MDSAQDGVPGRREEGRVAAEQQERDGPYAPNVRSFELFVVVAACILLLLLLQPVRVLVDDVRQQVSIQEVLGGAALRSVGRGCQVAQRAGHALLSFPLGLVRGCYLRRTEDELAGLEELRAPRVLQVWATVHMLRGVPAVDLELDAEVYELQRRVGRVIEEPEGVRSQVAMVQVGLVKGHQCLQHVLDEHGGLLLCEVLPLQDPLVDGPAVAVLQQQVNVHVVLKDLKDFCNSI
mmetsp:Transcript_109653/g.320948  ORF Transcript_109653/g.320948 Transcript_109653/m.320948 type:complete len:235 (-) Transcript_109653:497-1201(-)